MFHPGFAFKTSYSSPKREVPPPFEPTVGSLGITQKRIRPYTPHHNGKVERSHWEDQKRFYDRCIFFSLNDFGAQLAGHQSRTNNIPMGLSAGSRPSTSHSLCLYNLLLILQFARNAVGGLTLMRHFFWSPAPFDRDDEHLCGDYPENILTEIAPKAYHLG